MRRGFLWMECLGGSLISVVVPGMAAPRSRESVDLCCIGLNEVDGANAPNCSNSDEVEINRIGSRPCWRCHAVGAGWNAPQGKTSTFYRVFFLTTPHAHILLKAFLPIFPMCFRDRLPPLPLIPARAFDSFVCPASPSPVSTRKEHPCLNPTRLAFLTT